jgi:trk system potassium uptake protein TrkA
MRAVFVGASKLALMTVRLLLKRQHEVIIIERDREAIDNLSKEIDCGFLLGDGSKPVLLKEANPEQTDVLYCLTDNDQTNILASLVGRSLGFKRIVTKIDDPEFEHVCIELGLEDTIIPARTTGRHLADIFEGQDPLELSTIIRDEARVFSFVVKEEATAKIVSDLDLPNESRVICLYRGGKFILPESGTRLKVNDEVVVLTHRKNLPVLQERFIAS